MFLRVKVEDIGYVSVHRWSGARRMASCDWHGRRIEVPRKRICACVDVSKVEEVLVQFGLQGLK